MAKRTSGQKRSGAQELKSGIERTNRELLKLLNEHARLQEKLARALQQSGQPLYDPEREHQMLQQLLTSNRGPLNERCVRAVFRELFSAARALVRPLRVAYLGPMFSYSHQAALERFGSSAELVPVATIAAVFEELIRAHVQFGIVPIENSTDGRVIDTLGTFSRLPVKICGEVQLRIHHYLLGKCDRQEITEVYSKPQAISQCRDWLAKHLPLARAVEITSTAAAAQLAAEKPGAAAIASLQAGVNYGLNVIAERIEDNKNNVTRFAVIGDHEAPRTGRDKTAVLFQIPHLPGSLADATAVFKRNRINLTWIESFPLSGTESEYQFFVELEGHQSDNKVRRALEALRRRTVRLDVLGSYARAAAVD